MRNEKEREGELPMKPSRGLQLKKKELYISIKCRYNKRRRCYLTAIHPINTHQLHKCKESHLDMNSVQLVHMHKHCH